MIDGPILSAKVIFCLQVDLNVVSFGSLAVQILYIVNAPTHGPTETILSRYTIIGVPHDDDPGTAVAVPVFLGKMVSNGQPLKSIGQEIIR